MSKISRGMALPDTDHVMRYVSWNRLQKDGDDNIIGVLPHAFRLRENEDGLSVNWVEHYVGSHEERISQVVHELRATMDVRPKSAFGLSMVKAIKQTCRNTPRAIKVVYSPTTNIPSHALVRHIPDEDMNLLDALSKEAFCTLIHNSEIPV